MKQTSVLQEKCPLCDGKGLMIIEKIYTLLVYCPCCTHGLMKIKENINDKN